MLATLFVLRVGHIRGFGSIVTNKSGTSTAPITIKRAYALDSKCGSTTTGWNSAYDAQVVLVAGAAIVFRSSYITIDGNVSNGLKVSMVIRDCPGKTWNECFAVSSVGATNGITLRHLELSGPCNGDRRAPLVNLKEQISRLILAVLRSSRATGLRKRTGSYSTTMFTVGATASTRVIPMA